MEGEKEGEREGYHNSVHIIMGEEWDQVWDCPFVLYCNTCPVL